MPWSVKNGAGCPPSRPWAVIKDSDGSREGCHPTRQMAERQRRALYASERSARADTDITIAALNQRIEAATRKAFQHEDTLTDAYLAALQRAGGRAASRFTRQALTAAGFNEPFVGEGFVDIPEESAGRSQHEAALSFWEVIYPLLPIAFFTSEFLTAMTERAQRSMEQAVVHELQRIIGEAADSNLSVAQTATLIRDHLGEVSPAWARMFAQTQITALTNEGGLRAAEELEKRKRRQLYKTWLTQADNKVRPAHSATAGQTRLIHEPFDVAGYAMMYPGEPTAPLSLIANCRCFLSYSEALVASAGAPTLGGTMSETASNSVTEATLVLKPVIDWSEISYEIMTTDKQTNAVVTVDTGTEQDAAPTEAQRWRGVITMEGMSTGDGRYFAADAWDWRELPLTLLAQVKTDDGHDGAEVAGRIDRIWKATPEEAGLLGEFPDGAVAVMGEGVFDTGVFGQEIARMVGDLTLRGISVDFGVSEAGLWDTQELVLVEDAADLDPAEVMFGGRYERAAIKAQIGAATIVAHPAFANASVALVASAGEVFMPSQITLVPDEPALTASGAGLVPLHPPREWFENPAFEGPTPWTVEDSGRCYGHVALWGTCHTGMPGCEQPPHSATGYRYFHLKVVQVEDGGLVPCGVFTFDTGHATVSLPYKRALAHYDDTGTIAAQVTAGEDTYGIWIAGAIDPNLDAKHVRTLRAAVPSGDWRSADGFRRELMAVLAVNLPGFPVPRPEAHIALTASGEVEVEALIAAGIPEYVDPVVYTPGELRQIRVLTDSIE
jgi:hypothetical protein